MGVVLKGDQGRRGEEGEVEGDGAMEGKSTRVRRRKGKGSGLFGIGDVVLTVEEGIWSAAIFFFILKGNFEIPK